MAALIERPAIMPLARNPLMLTNIAWLYTATTVTLILVICLTWSPGWIAASFVLLAGS